MPNVQPFSDFETARKNMVLGQLIPNRVLKSGILDAMGSVPRELFLPERLQGLSYADEPVVIREGLFLFEPLIEALLLQCADLKERDVVLNVRAGTGYTAALLAKTARAVIALEQDASLCETAQDVLVRLETDNAAVLNMPAESGFPSQAPFDVIFIGGIVLRPYETLISQLAEGGRMVYVEAKAGSSAARAKKITKTNGVLSFVSEFDFTLSEDLRLPEYKKFVFEDVS